MKKGRIIALLLLLVGSIGAFVWYSRLKNESKSEGGAYDETLKPRVEMSTLAITNIDDDQIDVTAKILIDNPLPASFKANKVNYSVYINGQEVVKDSYQKEIQLRSKDSTTIAVPARLMRKKLTTVLEDLHQRGVDSTNYRLRATFDLDVPILGERTFIIDQTRRLPTYHVPKFEVAEIDYGKLSLTAMDVAAKINIINKNKYPYNITDTHYAIVINGKQIAEGDQVEPILIKKQATTPVVFPVTIKPGKALGLLPRALFAKKNTPIEISFRCKILDKNNNPMFQNSKFVTTIRGTLADFTKPK